MPTTQTREHEIQEENLQAITSTHGFYLHGLNVGEFHPPTSRGHRYALTAVCMLTGFTWCVPLKTKTAEEVAKAYMDHIYSNFGGSIKILMDNGTEFKNKLFKEVVEKLGTEFSIHSPPYRPQSNEKIEGFHIPEDVYRQTHQLWIGVG